MSTLDAVIETRGLQKRYGTVAALRGLDLRVPAGSIYGLVGRNGAGKTTTIKTLLGMVHATSGNAHVFGYDCGDARGGVAIRRRTAHVGEDRAIWPALTAEQVLAVSRPLFPGWRADLESHYLDLFEIPRGQAVGRFSRGREPPSRCCSRCAVAPTSCSSTSPLTVSTRWRTSASFRRWSAPPPTTPR